MLEVIYRIYEIPTEEQKQETKKAIEDGLRWRTFDEMERRELCMDVLICESRDEFKNRIKEFWGED